MQWTEIDDKALDDGLFFQDFNELKDNVEVVKQFPKRIPMGGDPKQLYENTAFTIAEDPIYVEIDGTNLAGLGFELHFMGEATSDDTVSVEVWDSTNSSQLVVKTFTNTSLALVKSGSFTLPAEPVTVYVRVKATIGGAASPFRAYGFHLVQK
jgi:hypothetical protein